MGSVNGRRIGLTQFGYQQTAPTFSNHTLDANNDGVAWVFQAPDAVPITHVGFRYGARTGTPPTYAATLEGVSTSTGHPDGADVGGGSPTAATFTPPASTAWDGLWQWVALTNSYTPARGQLLAFTIRYSSGTVDASNLGTFTSDASAVGAGASVTNFPYSDRLTAASWTKRAVCPVFGVRTASTRYGYPVVSFTSVRSASTVGLRQALKFTVPGSWTFKVLGARFNASLASLAGKNPILGLWSAGGVIQNVTLDTDVMSSATNCSTEVYFDESSLTTLNCGTAYYLGLEVADAVSGGVLLNTVLLDSSSDLLAFPDGSNFHFATYNGSAWSDDQTQRPFVELILDDVTEAAGGGVSARVSSGDFRP